LPNRAAESEAASHAPPGDAPLDLRIPYLTAELSGIGGTIKAIPDDFVVEEIPSYEPSGMGDHLFLWIEKRGVAAEELTRHIARALRIHTGQIGVAGMKDRHALTRQFVSVPRSAERLVPEINSSEIQVLSARPHSQKLRTGHLRGNRFRILVRDVPENAAALAVPVRDLLMQHGLPNFFGAQRFGRDQETATMGMQLLRGEITAPPADWSRKRFLRKLALSAGQAVLYNRYLVRRMHDVLLRTVLDGDVMFKQTCGIFYVTDRAAEQARFDTRETVHAGPIFGKKTFPAHGAALARESAILSDAGITPTQLRSFGPLLSGTRRRNLVYVDDLAITPLPHGLEFRFSLPAGSYATVLLAEFMKAG
jgi:tRNA pseudouridine13 synthase